jgi:hypothetical protein
MKTFIIKYLYIPVLFFALASCDFGSLNVDPTALSEEQVTSDLILPKAQVQSAFNLGATAGRYAGIWMQQFEGVEAQQVALTNYNLTPSDVNNTWEFQLYVGSMRDCITILDRADNPDDPQSVYGGIARILLAQNLGFATQLWGDIPYSQAFLGVENLKPSYDTQEDIYGVIQTLLDEAITLLGQDPVGIRPSGDDLIFGGDTDLWIATARSLKARYFLQLSKRDSQAASKALAAISDGAISTVENQPDFPFGSDLIEANPIALFEENRASTLQFSPAFFNTVLAGDPRRGEYAADDGNLLKFTGDDLYWGRNDSPMPLISYTETKFIEAEALFRTGDAAGAAETLNEAIKSNMYQVLGDSSSTEVKAYVNANSVLDGTEEENLDQIITEKYKALYVQGMVEVWSDYRRTGFPSFIVPVPGASLSVVPRRLLYPQSELLTNADNVADAASRQGGDGLDKPFWAFN